MRRILLAILCMMTISANGARMVDGVNYELDRENLTATVVALDNYGTYKGDIVIPEKLTLGNYTFTVVSIANSAFNGSGITSVSLPKTIVEIGNYAFEGSYNLTSLSLPDGIKTIGERAFRNCKSINKLKLPNNDVLIKKSAFESLSNLTELTIPDGWTQIGNEKDSNFFSNCESLRKVTIGKNVATIWSSAFSNCTSLTEIVCSNDGALTYIGSSAFTYCTSLTSMKFIPRSVKTLGVCAFSYCSALEEIYIPSNIEVIGSGFWNVKTTKLVIEDGTAPFTYSGSGRALLNATEVYLGRAIRGDVSYGQPFNTWDLKKLTFGPQFSCGTEWDFGNGVKEIYSYVTDPSVITCKFSSNVYDNATLYVPKGTKAAYAAQSNFAPFFDIQEMAGGKPEVGTIFNLNIGGSEIPFKVTSNNPMEVEVAQADPGKVSGSISIPKTVEIDGYTYSVTRIGTNAFYGCRSLTSVTIPNSVTNIGDCAFYVCSGLTSMTIPNSVTSIGDFAFCYCSGLTSVTIPKSVTSIGIAVFVSCSLTSIIVESGNTTYDSRNKCNAIIETKTNKLIAGCKNTIIPNSVTSIEWGAFNNCIGLTSVTIPNSVTSIGDHSFEQCTDLTSVTIGNSVTSIGDAAFASCKGLTSVTIGNSVISVGDGAFQSCSSLTTVTIGSSVTSIGKCAFFNTMLQHVYCYAEQVPWVDADAFPGSIRKATLHVPAGSVNAYKNTSPWSYFGNIVALEGGETYVGIAIDEKNFPDPVFRQLVWDNYDKNHNGGFSVDEAALVTKLNLDGMGITNLKGIEYFTSLIELRCNDNMLTSLDLSKNTALKVLYCKNNRIKDSAMDELIASLPNSGGNFYALQPNNSGEQNVVTKEQITAAKNKGWTIYYYTGSKWEVYDGNSSVKPEVGTIFNLNVGGNEIPFKVTSNNPMEVEVAQGDPAKVSGALTIPNTVEIDGYIYSVTRIGSRSFSNCGGLTSVIIPNSVTIIGSFAFDGCSGLKGKLIIPNTVTNIGQDSFRGCSGLTSVTIPNTVKIIEGYTFSGCSGLTSIIIPNSVTSIGAGAFSNCSGLTSVTIPNSVTIIGGSAFSGCSGLTSITIPNSVTIIGGFAFNRCSGLTSVTIPNSLTYIQDQTFNGCIGLTSITIPNSVTIIGDYAFSYCTGLTSLTIPSSVTSIGDDAFLGCSSLTSVTIPNSVTSIGGGAFWDCTGLTSITIPNSVIDIGFNAFKSCSGLTSIIVESGNSKYDSRNNCNAIIETASNTLIKGCMNTVIPNSVAIIENYAFYGCTGLTSVIIPNSVTSIGEWAFQGCSELTSVSIPNSVTSIGNNAFYKCKGLTWAILPNSVTFIGHYAFTNCFGLKDIYCYAEKIPDTDDQAFYLSSIQNVTLHVPASSINDYKNTAPWSGFGNIVALQEGDPSGIEAIKKGEQANDNSPVYNLNGQRVNAPAKGVYIKNGRKVLVK